MSALAPLHLASAIFSPLGAAPRRTMGRVPLLNEHPKDLATSPVGSVRLAAVVREHIDFVWRVLRRAGLSAADADDGTQRVFLVFRDKGEAVRPGDEKSYLFRVASLTAKELRRGTRRFEEPTDANMKPVVSALPRVVAADFLDKVMDELDDDEREAFVLFEIEELTMAEISGMLGCPPGTVASRIRRARDKVKATATILDGTMGGAP